MAETNEPIRKVAREWLAGDPPGGLDANRIDLAILAEIHQYRQEG